MAQHQPASEWSLLSREPRAWTPYKVSFLPKSMERSEPGTRVPQEDSEPVTTASKLRAHRVQPFLQLPRLDLVHSTGGVGAEQPLSAPVRVDANMASLDHENLLYGKVPSPRGSKARDPPGSPLGLGWKGQDGGCLPAPAVRARRCSVLTGPREGTA